MPFSTALDTVDGNCTHGDLRIASRTDDSNDLFSEGRLEVCVNRVWGTICDTAYGTRDAHVACGQLGYDGEGTYIQMHLYWMFYTYSIQYCNVSM